MLEPTITVRRAGRLDRDARRDLMRQGYAEYRAAMPEAFYAGWMEDLLDIEARERDAETYLAEIDGRPALHLVLPRRVAAAVRRRVAGRARPRAGRPSGGARGLGIGRRLVDRCIVRARVLAAPAISLHTADFMVAAKRLYERFGFRRVPRYDFDAATVVGLDSAVRLKVIAYSLALDPFAAR